MKQESRSQKLYQRIYQYLSEEISSGRLRPGDRVPSEKELSAHFKVSRITSKRALTMLAEEGAIERIPGKGSFVLSKQKAGTSSSHITPATTTTNPLIGVVLADFADAYGTTLLYGIEESSRAFGYNIVLHRSKDNPETEKEAIGQLLDIGVRGIVIMPVHGEYYSNAVLKLILDKFPLVFIDRYLKGLTASFVGTDNVQCAQQGIRFLFELGHRTIGFVSPSIKNTSATEDRLDGFVRGHAEYGIPINEKHWVTDLDGVIKHFHSEVRIARDIERVKNHLLEYPDITAIFAEEYNIAVIIREAAGQLGKRIPEELSIISVDCAVEVVGKYIPFTHLRQNEYEIGVHAIRMVHNQLQGENKIVKKLFPAELIIGASTANVLK